MAYLSEPMTISCIQCECANRKVAKYCKRCGRLLDQAGPFDALVGLAQIKSNLEERTRVVERMREAGALISMNHHTILVGGSGTGKTLIAHAIFDSLARWEVVTEKRPVYRNAPDFALMSLAEIEDLFKSSKGGMIVVDNAQELVRSDGSMEQGLLKLLGEMDKSGFDPIVVLCGLPGGLREFLKREENTRVTGRFHEVLWIDDYSSETLFEVVFDDLGRHHGFGWLDGSRERLLARCKYLAKESRRPDSSLDSRNGYLAKKEVEAVVRSYYLRGGREKLLSPEDVPAPVEEKKTICEVMSKLDSFVGMDSVKQSIRELHGRLEVEKRWISEGGSTRQSSLHAVVTGNPGTGKTSVARILGEIYAALGVLDIGHVVEVDRSRLVAGFKGQTAIQTNRVCDQAMGGVLFVDEAYSLKQSDNDDFGEEAIATLLKRVEDDRDKFVCILAGYQDDMFRLMSTNPGLESRFPNRFHFFDYTAGELMEIFRRSVEAEGRRLSDGASSLAREYFEGIVARKTKNFANGREARNLLDSILQTQSKRMSIGLAAGSLSREEMELIRSEDLPLAQNDTDGSLEQALGKLDELIGLAGVKGRVRELIDTLEVQRIRGNQELLGEHFVFLGNPGTGKTTVGRIMAEVFCAIGLLPTSNLLETDRAKMVSPYANKTAGLVNSLCDQALGGVLFIDEAYTLAQGEGDTGGKEAIDTLLKRMEDDRGKFVVIAAGYTKEMHDFISSNPGLPSRFTTTIEFEDYDAAEMTRIFVSMARSSGFELVDGVEEATLGLFRRIEASKTATFANARTVRQQLGKTRERLSRRIMTLKAKGESLASLQLEGNILRVEDLPLEDEGRATAKEKALARLQRQVGLAGVKKKVRELCQMIELQRLRGRERPINTHLVFTGNPGTGKTTVARILADVFYGIGLLPTNRLIEADRSTMVGRTVGSTAPMVRSLCERAMGGVLFIDEAYSLTPKGPGSNDFGEEAITTLLKRMEDDAGKFVVIAAGYTREMKAFISSNSGLRSRFSEFIEFDDYDGEEMTLIFDRFAEDDGYSIAPEARLALREGFDRVYASRDADFGNARTVRQIFKKIEGRIPARVFLLQKRGACQEEVRASASTICLEDVPLSQEELWR